MKHLILLLTYLLFNSCTSNIVSKNTVHYVDLNPRKVAALSQYKLIGDCGGFPAVKVKSAPGFCLGQVYNGEGMVTPRGIIQLNENEFLVTDMGPNWTKNTGKLYLLTIDNNQKTTMKVLLNAQENSLDGAAKLVMDRPNQITKDRFDNIYIASASSISRFHQDKMGTNEMIETVVSNIPTEGIHPLKVITFDKDNNMYVNVGSMTNVCQGSAGGIFSKAHSCPEVELEGRAAIYQYKYSKETNRFDQKFSPFVKGVRNSMVLMWDDGQNTLLQVENARDEMPHKNGLDDKQYPHDEMNVLIENKHYGWPYCFDNNIANPEFKNWDCSIYQKPVLLLPAHAAPLGGVNYHGTMFPEWYKNRYIFSFHGYEVNGHRLVTFKRNENLMPIGDPLSLIYGWDAEDDQAMGTPVGMVEARDGSLFIVEDKSRKVMRLFYDPAKGDGVPVKENSISNGKITDEEANDILERKIALTNRLSRSDVPLFSKFQNKVIDQSCIACHGGKNAPGIQLLQYDDIGNAKRIVAAEKAQNLIDRLSGVTGMMPMPPAGFASVDDKTNAISLIQAWIEAGMPIP